MIAATRLFYLKIEDAMKFNSDGLVSQIDLA